MIVTLAVSFALASVRDDPIGFRNKVAERLRQSGVPGISEIPRKLPDDLAHQFFARGELTQALAMVEHQGRGRLLRRRIEQQIVELHKGPPKRSSGRNASGQRVLHLLTNSLPFTNSGYTQRSHEVLRAQLRAGVRAEAVTRIGYPVVVGQWPRRSVDVIDEVTYHRLLPTWYPNKVLSRHEKATEMLEDLVKTRDVGVLHTTTNFPNALVASRVAQRCEIPWVYEVRGELERTWLSRLPQESQAEAEQSEYFRLARKQETDYARAADAVVVLSEISRAQLIDRGVDAARIHLIPNSIDTDLLYRREDKHVLRRELGLPGEVTIVGSVTSIVDYEGLDTLIRALLHLPDNHIALIVGEGTARPALETLTARLGLKHRVIFAGRQPQETIWKWYSALDVFVVPRVDTPVCRTVTPLKALSAQALGIPVIASDLPALREVTGEAAAFVDSNLPEVWAEAILGAPAGERGTEWAAKRTWDATAEQYRELYTSLGL